MNEPYYKDKLITIYNCSTFIWESPVIVLDPPYLLADANVFKGRVIYISTGNYYKFYEDQFPNEHKGRIRWRWAIPNKQGKIDEIMDDCIVLIGNALVPGDSVYIMKPLAERYCKWERPLELYMNILAETKGNVLDPFCGSGTTLVAAKKLGMTAIGFDIDEKMCEIAAKRCMEV